MKLTDIGKVIRKCFPSFAKRMDELSGLYDRTLNYKFQHRMFGQTTTRLDNGTSVNSGHFTAQKHNDTVDEYNQLKYWWMKKLTYVGVPASFAHNSGKKK